MWQGGSSHLILIPSLLCTLELCHWVGSNDCILIVGWRCAKLSRALLLLGYVPSLGAWLRVSGVVQYGVTGVSMVSMAVSDAVWFRMCFQGDYKVALLQFYCSYTFIVHYWHYICICSLTLQQSFEVGLWGAEPCTTRLCITWSCFAEVGFVIFMQPLFSCQVTNLFLE